MKFLLTFVISIKLMRILVFIILSFLSTTAVIMVLDAYDLEHLSIYLFDLPGEGNSEGDTSESSEYDLEVDSFDLLNFPILITQRNTSLISTLDYMIGNFMEIPHRPPRTA